MLLPPAFSKRLTMKTRITARRIHLLLGLAPILALVCILCSFQQATAMESGPGSYQVEDTETGKVMTVWYFKPAGFSPDTPVVFALHGTSRTPKNYRNQWQRYAEQYGFMLLAPDFSKELFPGRTYNLGNVFAAPEKGKALGQGAKNPQALWSYRVVDKLFADFAAQREKTAQSRYYLFGHSAGGQFVHRMLALLPDAKVKMAIAANSGWYSLPDLDKDWPYGFKGTDLTQQDMKRYLSLPLVVLLGEDDNDPKHHQLVHTREADAQGDNRLARGKFFFASGAALAEKLHAPFGWQLHLVPGGTHSNSSMAGAAAAIFAADMGKIPVPASASAAATTP